MTAVAHPVLFGLEFDPLRMDEVISYCESALANEHRILIGVANAAKIVNMRHDSALRDSLLECDLLLADGQSVVWASRLLRRPVPERVAGIDLFDRLLAHADHHRCRVYLLGAKADVLDRMREQVAQRYPNVIIAGYHDGYFVDSESAHVAEDIRNSHADMLFLGITSPKKEIFLGTYGQALGVPILHGVGGSFDIFAGVTKRAPLRWQRLGLEWLYRLLQEPQRMWKRYLRTNTAFIWLTMRELVRPTAAYRLTGR
jgi:N-acetylglucosaminyldiphosphoundecaprenol N-acetyl-beta-D-mannosaminyltransferase